MPSYREDGRMRFAASDVGTNSCRLLVAEISDTSLSLIHKQVVTTRIGEGVERTGRLNAAAIDRTLDCLDIFADVVEKNDVISWRVAATSAVREAANSGDILNRAEERVGVKIEVLSGESEGELSFRGARARLALKSNPLVIDVGGGSTEIIYSSRGIKSLSIPVGAVRATEADWNENDIKARFSGEIEARVINRRRPLVLVGGTATSLIAVKKRLKVYDPDQVQGEIIRLDDIRTIYDRLAGMELEERRQVEGLQPERADIIVKGILIIRCLLEILGRNQAKVSDSDLLDGLIWDSYFQQGTPVQPD